MKKGNRVNVNDQAAYSGQFMDWTELTTGRKKYKKGHIFYHYSDSFLKEFKSKITCFCDTNKIVDGYCYALILKKDIEIETYGDEVRFDIDENSEIIYLGKVKMIIDYNCKVPDSRGGFSPKRIFIDNRIKL
jgi:hypothetical protein